MSIPVPPWWLRLLPGGNTNNFALAGIAFLAGYFIGKGDSNHWKHVARSGDNHWRDEYGWHDDHHGHCAQKEHERENHRRGYERG